MDEQKQKEQRERLEKEMIEKQRQQHEMIREKLEEQKKQSEEDSRWLQEEESKSNVAGRHLSVREPFHFTGLCFDMNVKGLHTECRMRTLENIISMQFG